ncbi:MAG TPA: glycerol-3-phosphate acyltransferase, partial [Bdellovibrionota bacterium]|nr:glycerol-3-phosphate acyltransferase [Bdellovibrionota bacterium]
MWMVIGAILGYCIGTIPTGLIVGKLFFKKDIRDEGSGNIGATNVLRSLGKLPGLTVLVFDALKAFILPYFLVKHLPWGDSVANFKSEMSFMEMLGEMIRSLVSDIAEIQYSAFIVGVAC